VTTVRGVLSPLLSNILLTDFDREIEKRGLSFCRYADDCNVYVKTQRSGERVMAGLTEFLEKRLKLKINPAKSAVAKSSTRKFLGYSLTARAPHIRIASQSLHRLTAKLRDLIRVGRGGSLTRTIAVLNPVLRGWMGYFRLAPRTRAIQTLDGWIRRKLRGMLWRQWQRPTTRYHRLLAAGLRQQRAWKSASNGRGAWWNSGASHMNAAFPKAFFDRHGLISLVDLLQSFLRP
jgi:RNA-directed DNA polymerase